MSTDLPPDPLAVTRADGVATVWLNRPDKRNAVSYQMWLGMARLVRRVGVGDRPR